MAIRLHCDRCGVFVQAIPEPKDLAVFKKEVICKKCTDMEAHLTTFADRLKNKWATKVEELILSAKTELKEELEKLKNE